LKPDSSISFKSLWIISVSLFVIIIGFSLMGCDSYNSWRTYNKAEDALNQGDIEVAFTLLESIPNYDDPKNIRQMVIYKYASYLSTVKKFEKAVELYQRIIDFKDSNAKLKSTYKSWAIKLTALGEHGKALEIYEKLGEKEQALEALLHGADENINIEKYSKALSALEKVTNNSKATDLGKAAKKGALYLKVVEALNKNDFSSARSTIEKAVKIRHNKNLVFEQSYLEQYCTGLKAVVTRLGAENKYAEVLRAVYPVWHMIIKSRFDHCKDCIKVMSVAEDRYLYKETNTADWHQKIENYRNDFSDITARCNVYGGLMNEHSDRTGRLINVLMALEKIGDECNGSEAPNWKEATNSVELTLSTMVLGWKKKKQFKKIIILQKYVTNKLKGLPLELGGWGEFKESELKPEYNFTSTHLKGNKHIVTGWISNPSNYRPLIVAGVSMDCKNKETRQISANCAQTKFSRTILPSKRIALNGFATVPSGTGEIVQFSLNSKYEDVNVANVQAEDIFSQTDIITIIKP